MSLPLVSVVIPVFNNEDTINETLDSVVNQDYINLEIIVVNDGSTDNTEELLNSYKQIRIINQENSGSAVARSKGIHAASGKYIAFIDADDLWVPWKISTQVECLENNPDAGMAFNSWLEIHNENDMLPRYQPCQEELLEVDNGLSGWLYAKLLMDCVIHTSSVIILKSICEKVGDFNLKLRRGQDYDYWIRVSQVTKIIKLKSVLSAYRIHESSITYTLPKENYEAIILINAFNKYGLTDQAGNKISKKLLWQRLTNSWKDYCWVYYNANVYNKSFYASLKIIKYSPFGYIGWGYLFSSIFRITMKKLKIKN